jgi:hypothetical protein
MREVKYQTVVTKAAEIPDFTREGGEEVQLSSGRLFLCYCGWERFHRIPKIKENVLVCMSCLRTYES